MNDKKEYHSWKGDSQSKPCNDKDQNKEIKKQKKDLKTKPKALSAMLKKPKIKLTNDYPILNKTYIKTSSKLNETKEFNTSKKVFGSFDITAKVKAKQRFNREIYVGYTRKVRKLWSSYRKNDVFMPSRFHRTTARKSYPRIPLISLRTSHERSENTSRHDKDQIISNVISKVPKLKMIIEGYKDNKEGAVLPETFKVCLGSSVERQESRVEKRPHTSNSRKIQNVSKYLYRYNNPFTNTLIKQYINPILNYK